MHLLFSITWLSSSLPISQTIKEEMISILFAVVFAEMATITTLLFRNPLRKIIIIGIDQLKKGRGPLVAKTVAATLSAVFGAILYSVMQIQKRVLDSGVVNSTDEVLVAERLLEASLMGFSLFLAMMTDRLHYYIKELHVVREELEEVKTLKQNDETEKVKAKETEVVPKRRVKEAKPANSITMLDL